MHCFGLLQSTQQEGEKSKCDMLETLQFALALARFPRHGDYFHTSATAEEASVSIMIPNKFKQNPSEIHLDK